MCVEIDRGNNRQADYGGHGLPQPGQLGLVPFRRKIPTSRQQTQLAPSRLRCSGPCLQDVGSWHGLGIASRI